MPQQAKASKSKPPRRLRDRLLCGLAGSRSKKAGATQSQGSIKPLSAPAARPLQSARFPRQTTNAAGKQPDRSAVIPDVAVPDTKPKIVRRPTPIPSSSPHASRAASIRTSSNQKVRQASISATERPIPGSWTFESSQDTFHETVMARTPSSAGNHKSAFSGGYRKPSYASSSMYKPSGPAHTYSSTTYTTPYIPSYDYSSSHYGGHSSGGGWGGDSGGGSSGGGGGSCGGGGGGGDGGGGGGGGC